MDDDETSLALVPTSTKKRNTAKCQARITTTSISTRAPSSRTQHLDGNSSSSEDGSDDEEYGNNYDPDAPDQDEDVIRDAEDAQQTDLVEAAQSAELELMVKDYQRKVASTALAKVSLAITIKTSKGYLLISFDSSLNLRIKSTTRLALSRSWSSCAMLPASSHSA
jgi:hypothetical protein